MAAGNDGCHGSTWPQGVSVGMKIEWKPSRRILYRIVAGVVVCLVAVTGVFAYRSCIPGLVFEDGRAFAATLEPLSADSLGVASDSTFTLTLGEAVPLAAVRSAFSIEPAIEFTVKSAGEEGKVFKVTPDEPLAPDHVYRFALNLAGSTEPGYSWAYQVASQLRVAGCLPGDRSAGVPTSTGIEIEFSHDGVNDPGSYFSISPFVPGTWERHRRTLVYVPRASLTPGSLYTCTLKKGLGVQGSDAVLAEDYTFSFETEERGGSRDAGFWFYIDSGEAEFAPTEAPFFTVNYGKDGGESGAGPKIATKVSRYRDSAAYLTALVERDKIPYWAYVTRQTWEPSTAGLEPVLEADLDIQTYEWQSYVALPGPLEPGYYLVSFRLAPFAYYAWVQVTDLSCYAVAATNDTVLWFNSLKAGSPVGSVAVRQPPGGAPLGTSNADGLVRFTTPQAIADPVIAYGSFEPVAQFYVTARAPDGSELVLNLSPGWNPYDEQTRLIDNFWSYLYTDRPLYLPDDTVRFWGVMEPRNLGVTDISRVGVELRTSNYCWEGPLGWGGEGGADATLVSAQEVEVKRHTFDGSVALPNLRPGYYRLELTYDGAVFGTQYFEVATYSKPAYRVTLTSDKRAVFVGQAVRYNLDASFFEGTPVSEMRFGYTLCDGDTTLSGILTTDVTGRAALTNTPTRGTDPFGVERQNYLNANANLPETGLIYADCGVRVFEKDVALRVSATAEPTATTIEAKMNKVTLDKINAPGPDAGWGEESYLGDPVADRSINGQLLEIRWEARETGQYYDFVQKITRKTYDYTEVRVPIQGFTMTTAADGTASWTFTHDPAKSYYVRLDSQDDSGRATAAQLYFHGGSFIGPDYGYRWYYLATPDRQSARYAVGETATVVVQERETTVPSRARGFLFYTGRQGLDAVTVEDDPEYSLTFEEGFIPNTNVGAVYFDGRYYNEVGSRLIGFDYSGRELQVTVTTDKESYAPGDRVVFGVEVKDNEGRPVGAEVNLCLVDEALFALSGQSVDLLSSLYGRTIGDYVFLTRGSHYRRLLGGGGAECGGEGGGRQDFRDAALFESLTTGADGQGTVETVLPDNLTSWRLTYQAYASGVRAGSGSLNVPVRLPFFVELSINQTYLAGDSPIVQARAYGAALPSGTAVTFAAQLARLKPDGAYEPVDLSPVAGTSFKPADIDLGRLEKGNYRLTVTGQATPAGGQVLEDTLTKPIEVLDTYLRLDRMDYYEVGEGLTVTADPGELATLTFCDQERGKYLGMLWRLSGSGRRLDMKAAAVVARRLLLEHFEYTEELIAAPPTASELLTCQRSEGGIALLPYADASLELTAKVAALGEVGFDRDGLLSYLGQVYDDETQSRERFIISLYGLAALEQPVLSDLRKVASEPDLSVKEKLYACLGLIELGDEETARDIFGGVLEASGDRIGPLLRLNVSRDQEEIIAATSLAAVVAAGLKMPDKTALFEYLLDNVPWEELNFLEMSRFLEVTVPSAPSTSVSFTLGPDGKNVSLKPGETYTCLRPAEDLPSLGFTKIQGKVGLCVAYRSAADLSQTRIGGGEASLSRDYFVGGRKVTTFGAGDVVKVVLGWGVTGQAPEGPYQLVDFLPSGLKAVPRVYELGISDSEVDYPAEVDGQKVTFNVYIESGTLDPATGKPAPRGGSDTVTYYARVVSLGQYQADPAVLVHVKSGEIFAATGKDELAIKP